AGNKHRHCFKLEGSTDKTPDDTVCGVYPLASVLHFGHKPCPRRQVDAGKIDVACGKSAIVKANDVVTCVPTDGEPVAGSSQRGMVNGLSVMTGNGWLALNAEEGCDNRDLRGECGLDFHIALHGARVEASVV